MKRSYADSNEAPEKPQTEDDLTEELLGLAGGIKAKNMMKLCRSKLNEVLGGAPLACGVIQRFQTQYVEYSVWIFRVKP